MRGNSLLIVFLAVICLKTQVHGIKCWLCNNAINNDECLLRGKIETCTGKGAQTCVNIIVSKNDGSLYEITKRCKRNPVGACKSDGQNQGVYPYKCQYNDVESVCECCCSTDVCNGPQMECKDARTCKKPDHPGNGKIRCPKAILYGSKCNVQCDRGFSLTGPRQIVCMNGTDQGHWSPKEPVSCLHREKASPKGRNGRPTMCEPKMVDPEHGSMVCENAQTLKNMPKYKYVGSKCAFRCDTGYFMSGPEVVQCLPGGQWSVKPPTCEQGVCEQPVQDKNRIDDCSKGFFFGSTCTMSCKEGYTLIGNSNSTCNSISENTRQGRWSNAFSTCARAECRPQLQKPSNGRMECTNMNLKGTICTFICDEGYDLTDTDMNTVQIECVEEGGKIEWNNVAPKCERISCKRIEMPENGNVACLGDGRLGSTCTFSCKVGFDLVGHEEEKLESKCQDGALGDSEGIWSQQSITCEPIKCEPAREAPENGFVYCSNDNVVGSTCTFSCEDKYDLDDTNEKVIINICEGDSKGDGTGKWSANPGSCSTRFSCGAEQVDPEHGSVSCSDGSYGGSICEFACREGYELNGIDRATCSDLKNDGDSSVEWSNEAPVCVPSTCPEQWYDTTVMSVSCTTVKEKNTYQVGTNCTYTCTLPGYNLEFGETGKGNGGITCLKKNTWSQPAAPRCAIKTCERIGKLKNGHQPSCTNDNKFDSQCSFTCDARYVLSHTDPVLCEEITKEDKNGVWDKDPPVCTLNECPKVPADPVKGKVTCSSGAKLGSYCTLACDRGYAAKVNRIDCNYKIDIVDGEEIKVPRFQLLKEFCCAECRSDLNIVQIVDGRFKSVLQKMVDFSKIIVNNLATQQNKAFFSTVMYNDQVFEDTLVKSTPIKEEGVAIAELFEQMQGWEIEVEGKSSDTQAALDYANDVMFAKYDDTAANFLIVSADDSPDNVDAGALERLKERGIHILIVASNNFAKIKWERLLDGDDYVMNQDSNTVMEKIFELAFQNGCSNFADKCA